MARRIEEDWKDFRGIIDGSFRKALRKFINNGTIFRTRPRDGKTIPLTIPRVDIPHIVHGENNIGIGKGKGKPGDAIKKDKEKGNSNDAGTEHQDGITIILQLEDVLKFLKDELKLPDLKSKPNQVYEEVKIKYNNISLQGPESLRHNRRTMLQALKRMSASGEINKLHFIPGFADPVKMITPINSDRRYRQYREIRIPSSNAVIFFARDGSGSMDEYKCDIVSRMAWWIDLWIKQYYKRTECVYIWHDSEAKEVNEHDFYAERYGGGTICSSALDLIGKQFEIRYPPDKWNIYIIYFTDGENVPSDNEIFNKIIRDRFPPEVVNMVGIAQILPHHYEDSLKRSVDHFQHKDNIRTTDISADEKPHLSSAARMGFYGPDRLDDAELDKKIKNAIIDLLGSGERKEKKEVAEAE